MRVVLIGFLLIIIGLPGTEELKIMMNWEEVKTKWTQASKFKSDGCSGAPDLFWKDCCREHDFYYRFPSTTFVSRSEADKRLRLCMRKKGSGRIVSWTYWAVVRVIGWRFWDKRK